MGPHSFERGNCGCWQPPCWHSLASMGPHSFERGNRLVMLRLLTTLSGFNGASLFRARKHAHTWEGEPDDACFNGASLFRARKLALKIFPHISVNLLQWGLTLSSEETTNSDKSSINLTELQWGLTLSSEETVSFIIPSLFSITLQWGLTLSSEETSKYYTYFNWFRLLQWGLTLSSEETTDIGRTDRY